jgi:hypothetical protein
MKAGSVENVNKVLVVLTNRNVSRSRADSDMLTFAVAAAMTIVK